MIPSSFFFLFVFVLFNFIDKFQINIYYNDLMLVILLFLLPLSWAPALFAKVRKEIKL